MNRVSARQHDPMRDPVSDDDLTVEPMELTRDGALQRSEDRAIQRSDQRLSKAFDGTTG